MDCIRFDVSSLGEGFPVSRNFMLVEAQSHDKANAVYIHPAAIVLAQTLRDQVGAIKVLSWYRSRAHNKAVGGAKESTHVYGMALDLRPLEADLGELIHIAKDLDVGGLGIYKDFIHVDVYGYARRWSK